MALRTSLLIRCVSCCVDNTKIASVTGTSVTLKYRRPIAYRSGRVIKYVIKYRKVGSRDWTSATRTTAQRQDFPYFYDTVTGLDPHTQYQFHVVATAPGEPRNVYSYNTAKTKGSKCSLLNFSLFNRSND